MEALSGSAEVETEFGVWPENWDIVRAFMAISSQWRISIGMAGAYYSGLDYAGVRAGLKGAGFKIREVWDGIRVMEGAARSELNRALKAG